MSKLIIIIGVIGFLAGQVHGVEGCQPCYDANE